MMVVEKKKDIEEKKQSDFMVEIKKVYEEEGLKKYLVKGANITFMNALRRTIMRDVECLAVDTVTIYDNDSVIVDEMLSHRTAMLPIRTDVKSYKTGSEVKLVLEAEGPCTVTSKDMKSTDPKIEIIDKNIPITKLGKGKKLKIEMNAKMGSGAEHAKFQPAIVSYNQLPFIENSKKYDSKVLKEFPNGVIEEKAGKLFLIDPYNLKLKSQHEDLMEKNGIVIDYKNDEFVLMIEETGQLTAKEVVEKAVEKLKEKVNDFEKEIKKL